MTVYVITLKDNKIVDVWHTSDAEFDYEDYGNKWVEEAKRRNPNIDIRVHYEV